MRDLIFSLVLGGALAFALRRPDVGVYLWTWLSTMNPHTFTYGFARSLPWAQVIAIVTFIAFLTTPSRRHGLPRSAGLVLMVLLVAWMCVTSLFSINPPADVTERWIFVMKIFVMLFLTLAVLRGRTDIERLIWIIVISLAVFGIKGGVWTVLTGGGGRVWGPPGGMLADNNSLGVGLVTVLPWMYYLFAITGRRWLKLGLGLGLVFTAFAILGTQSRGALLSLLAMAFLLGLKGKNPWRSSIALAALVVLAIAFMPDSWTARMDTIQGYQADTSAMSRLWTWQTLWNLAVDRPLVGGGFRSDSAIVFSLYSPIEGREIYSQDVYVAHSIYFQALGEHGFPGLFLYLALGVWTWVAAARLSKQTVGDPEFGSWVPLLMRMCQTGLVGFAVGGAFLSLMNLDLPYYIPAIVLLTQATVKASRSTASRQEAVDVERRLHHKPA